MEALHQVPAASLETIIGAVRDAADRPLDDPTMHLSPAEQARALEIKEAVEADHRLASLSDFECVQWALTTVGESTESVLERVFRMQCFRGEYKLSDTLEEGIVLFFQHTKTHPGHMLAMEYLPSSENYIAVSDYAAFYPASIKTDEQYRIFMGANFYQLQAQQPNFRAIRNGVSLMVECQDSSFENLDVGLQERYMVELFASYPQKLKEWFWVNSATVANMTCALWRRFLRPNMKDKFFMGHQIPGIEEQRLDDIYCVPNPAESNERMMLKALKFLALRYQNQKKFRLKQEGVAAGSAS